MQRYVTSQSAKNKNLLLFTLSPSFLRTEAMQQGKGSFLHWQKNLIKWLKDLRNLFLENLTNNNY